MKKLGALSFMLVLALALGFQAHAQQSGSDTYGNTSTTSDQTGTEITGRVTSVSGNTVTVQTDSGDQMTFTVASSSILPSAVAEGSRVRVRYNSSGGAYQATSVTLDTSAPATSTTGATGSSTYGNTGATGTSRSTYDNTNTSTSTTTSSDMNDMNMRHTRTGRLPATASPMPLIGVFAGLALAAAAGLRLIGRL